LGWLLLSGVFGPPLGGPGGGGAVGVGWGGVGGGCEGWRVRYNEGG
jgi:hypothetical protein